MLTMGRRSIRSQRRTVAPARQPPSHWEERYGGRREGAGSKAPPHIARSRALPGGRPSAREVLLSLPPGRGPVVAEGAAGVPFAPWRRPGFRTPQRWSMVAQGGALVWRYEARLTPVKVSAHDTLT